MSLRKCPYCNNDNAAGTHEWNCPTKRRTPAFDEGLRYDGPPGKLITMRDTIKAAQRQGAEKMREAVANLLLQYIWELESGEPPPSPISVSKLAETFRSLDIDKVLEDK